jgi:hypothetical protein
VNAAHLRHCAGTLVVDKTQRLRSKLEHEIKQEVEVLKGDIQRVEDYPFSRWAGELADLTEAKLRKCMVKYNSNLTNLPEFMQGIETLRKRVTDRVGDLEGQMRKAWKAMTAAKAEHEREQVRRELSERIASLEQANQQKDQNAFQESVRLHQQAENARKQEFDRIIAIMESRYNDLKTSSEHRIEQLTKQVTDLRDRVQPIQSTPNAKDMCLLL